MVDLTYFFINSLLVEVLTILTLKPALILFDWARADWLSGAIGGSPIALQVLLIVLVADFTRSWVHRNSHSTAFLWPFHAIHHSAEEMDWLAGSRLHLINVILTRGLTYVPVFVLGFANAALIAYVFLVAAQATFIHANVRWRFRAVSAGSLPRRRFITGTTAPSAKRSTRISRSTRRSGTSCSAPTTSRTVGRPHMVSAASATFRAAGSNSCSIHSFA